MSKDYSQKALSEFLDYAAKTGLMAKATAQSRKSATQKMLAVLHDDEGQDLRELDIEDVTARFANRHKTDYTTESLRVYQSRARTAITDFISWVDDPSNFKPAGKRSTKRTKAQQDAEGGQRRVKATAVTENSNGSPSSPSEKATTFSIPIPVRDGFIVEVAGLPIDLRPDEAQRIAGIVTAYATKEDK